MESADLKIFRFLLAAADAALVYWIALGVAFQVTGYQTDDPAVSTRTGALVLPPLLFLLASGLVWRKSYSAALGFVVGAGIGLLGVFCWGLREFAASI